MMTTAIEMLLFLLLVLRSVVVCSPATARNDDPILVVGGGLSGLSAVLELERMGYATTLVEASHRLGGRVSSHSSLIELGGTYLHGSSSPLVDLIVKEYKLPTVVSGGGSQHPGMESAVWTTTDGQVLDKEQTETRASFLYKQWLDGVQTALKNYTHVDDEETTIALLHTTSLSVMDDVTRCHEDKNNEDDCLLDRAMLKFEIQMAFEHDVGVPFPHVSLGGVFNNWDWIENTAPDCVLRDGLESVIHAMRHNVRGVILLNRPVTLITYGNQTCTLTLQGKDDDDDESSAMLTSRACIVTIPLGVLKAHHESLFEPPLPLEKQQALQRAGVAAFNTLIITWNKPLCRAGAYYLLQKDNDDDAAAALQANPLSSGFVCPQVLRGNETDAYTTQFYVHGDQHPFHDDSFWKRQAIQVVNIVLSHDVTQEDILDLIITKWHEYPFILGSYSAPSTSTRGNADRAILQESLDGAVFFAGEHTNTCGRYQSLDGAYDTGIHAARQAAAALQRLDNSGDIDTEEVPMTCQNIVDK